MNSARNHVHRVQRELICYVRHTQANKHKAQCPKKKSVDSLDIDWIWAFIQQHCPLRAVRGRSVWILLRQLLRTAADGRWDNVGARVTRFGALFRRGNGGGYTGGDRVKVIVLVLQTGSLTDVCGWNTGVRAELITGKKKTIDQHSRSLGPTVKLGFSQHIFINILIQQWDTRAQVVMSQNVHQLYTQNSLICNLLKNDREIFVPRGADTKITLRWWYVSYIIKPANYLRWHEDMKAFLGIFRNPSISNNEKT